MEGGRWSSVGIYPSIHIQTTSRHIASGIIPPLSPVRCCVGFHEEKKTWGKSLGGRHREAGERRAGRSSGCWREGGIRCMPRRISSCRTPFALGGRRRGMPDGKQLETERNAKPPPKKMALLGEPVGPFRRSLLGLAFFFAVHVIHCCMTTGNCAMSDLLRNALQQ